MKVSIITINLNSNIERTIKSIQEQTYQNIEHIIIDARIEKDNGRYDGMNKGIKKATGDIIMILNAGDIYINEYVIENIIKNIQKTGINKADIFHGNNIYYNIDTGAGNIKCMSIVTIKNLAKGFIPHNATIYTKKAFEKNGLFNIENKIGSDLEWCIKAFLNGLKFFYIDILIGILFNDGISSQRHDLVKKERELILKKYGLKK